MMEHQGRHWIAGRLWSTEHESCLPIMNPATAESLGQVSLAQSMTCQRALTAARDAFVSWSKTTPAQRAEVFFQFRQLLKARQLDLAELLTYEHGKTLEDARGSIQRGIELLDAYCSNVARSQTTYTTQVSPGMDCTTIRQPLGVCLGVSPFNFPVMVPLWMMIPAIACGNTFILKPSEQTPSAPFYLAQWLTEAGLPPGVVNVVQGQKEAVSELMASPDVQAVTAVASTPVAEAIYQQAVQNHQRAHTFGGAKNHALVMPDAPSTATAQAIVGAAFGSAGERCMALSVAVVVGDAAANALLTEMVVAAKSMRVGPGYDPSVDMGPLISAAHRQRVLQAIDQGVADGARLVLDGRGWVHAQYPQGYYVGPTLFDQVTPGMRIYQEEIFGPVLAVVRVSSREEGLALINQHPYGNGAAIFTERGAHARWFVQEVSAGMVGVNVPIPVPVVTHPFGGWKRSSFGDLPMHGEESIRFYTRTKSVTSRWIESQSAATMFHMPVHPSS